MTPNAIYRRIKFCQISTGNFKMVAWKPEVHFRKSAKVVYPILNLPIKSKLSNKRFHRPSTTSNFHGHLMWSDLLFIIDAIFLRSVFNPPKVQFLFGNIFNNVSAPYC